MELALEQAEFWWDYFDALSVAAFALSVLILISAADDLFLDGWYWTRRLKLKLQGRSPYLQIPEERLRGKPERLLAIMAPAWHEYDVIGRMLENMVATLDYSKYVVFAGTYPNDDRTIAEVERMRRRYRHLVRVEVPNPGPTSKADCLNAIVRAIFAYEEHNEVQFAGAILHDSEDVLHSLELKFFNWMLDTHDLIQIPVIALERQWWEVISGTYMDEFAEWHAKDLVVRESMTGTVPSAGVGTCFSKRALQFLSRENPGEPFNTSTLTEDYDIAERLARAKMKSTIAHYPVTCRVARYGFSKRRKLIDVELPLCVREYFPSTFKTSYRQKARWTLGIALQGWQQLGWSRSVAANYFLFRDRKVLLTSFIGVAVYFLILNIFLLSVAVWVGAWRGPTPEIFNPEDLFGTIVTLNVAAFFLRLMQRAWFVSRIYGWKNGLLSSHRLIVGTIVNAAATLRAIRQFALSKVTGRKLTWDKTMHHFPPGNELVLPPRNLREILISWRVINNEELSRAIGSEPQSESHLGQVLVSRGLVDAATLDEAMAYLKEVGGGEQKPRTVATLREPLKVS